MAIARGPFTAPPVGIALARREPGFGHRDITPGWPVEVAATYIFAAESPEILGRIRRPRSIPRHGLTRVIARTSHPSLRTSINLGLNTRRALRVHRLSMPGAGVEEKEDGECDRRHDELRESEAFHRSGTPGFNGIAVVHIVHYFVNREADQCRTNESVGP